ncbi:hypothetical protein BV509_07630 [Rhodovulum sulfidophilum]|uniref:TspO/MBR related protein n=1 Tax=Rhodovulum visakhapatnamense TaxID=364297 RepID=A0ABS1RGQ8_9RHOB|nr:hypothetical protein [Rhodovulum visakhapatnamense]MBL3571735.1 hypothetical protein [Rhodovulum visakhapatnamense]MBL3578813.1 hypothetical protein [Rhodovulum visakhapatnamense]OLS44219.1 hypothetical protein BV509_07630 [Rhodovulum sulfidophilum]
MIDPVKAVLVFVATVFFVASAVMPGGFSGFEPSQFPIPQDDPPVQPAGYAFAIWGVIYVWLVISAGFGLFRRAGDGAWERCRLPLILSLAPGAAWIGVAQLSPVWASLLLWWMAAMAIWALVETPLVDRWWLQAPVGLYAGWLTAASWVSVGLLGAGHGIVFGETAWALIALLGALATGAAVLFPLDRAPAYGVALIWGLGGIVVANLFSAPLVAIAALAGAVVIGFLTVRAAT